jgi:hypothetical protein
MTVMNLASIACSRATWRTTCSAAEIVTLLRAQSV